MRLGGEQARELLACQRGAHHRPGVLGHRRNVGIVRAAHGAQELLRQYGDPCLGGSRKLVLPAGRFFHQRRGREAMQHGKYGLASVLLGREETVEL